jgi:hypothetical protein
MAFEAPTKWMEWLPTAEYWYNTSFQTSIKMTPFEALYEYPTPHLTTLPDFSHLSMEAHETLYEKGQMVTILQHHLQLA